MYTISNIYHFVNLALCMWWSCRDHVLTSRLPGGEENAAASFHLLRTRTRVWRDGSVAKVTPWSWSPQYHSTAYRYNSSYRGSNTVYCPMWALHTRDANAYMQAKHSHTENKNEPSRTRTELGVVASNCPQHLGRRGRKSGLHSKLQE